MKRKSTREEPEGAPLFANQTFILSKTTLNKKKLETKITSLGGKIATKISKNVTYFVQDYNVDDDGRLASVKKHQVKVVSPVFIDRCEAQNRILDFHEYAIGLPTNEESTNKKAKTKGKDKTKGSDKDEKAFKIPETVYDELFREIRESDREDEEFPQTFDNFLEMPDKNMPTSTKKYMYILPLGYDPKEKDTKEDDKDNTKKGKGEYRGIGLGVVEEFLQAFFCVPTKILPFWKFTEAKNKTSLKVGNKSYPISMDKQNRLQVMDILEAMWDHIPKDACCVIGLTLHDIFESEWDDNQFWGRATGDGCGVISLNRFNPALFGGGKKDENEILSMSRSLNTIVHEAMHVFGIDHCVFYKCNMNSSEPILTNIDETLHLCPIDLRKLQHTFKFDIIDRYNNLMAFYKKYKFKYELNWITKRLISLT